MPRARPPITEAQQRFSFTRRAFVLRGAQTAVGAMLIARMGWLSIVESEHYQVQSEANRVNLALIPPRRGWIIDRDGRPLALNRTTFRVDVIPDRLIDKDKTIATLVQLLNLSPDDHQRILDSLDEAAGFQPVQIADNLSLDAYAALSIRQAELPGVAPAQSFLRFYPTGPAVAHLLGYVGTPSAKDYEESHNALLITPGFKVGKDGIEKVMENRLQGSPGARRTEVTARGRLVRDLANRPDIPGQNVRLTINANLQDYVARRLGVQSGACTILDCDTGDILAMASMPAYDPNSFSGGIAKSEYAMLLADDHHPLANKTLQGNYPSGSTIKPMMALALLAAGVKPEEQVVCTGSYRLGNGIFHCDKRTGHGAISMHRAIVQSCDIYFYHMGRQLGIEKIAAMMHQMSLGQRYDLPVPSQRQGSVPDPDWLQKHHKRGWNLYDTINLSIGQGYLQINPLQLAVMAGRIASGRMIEPHLLLDHPHGAAPPMPIDQEHLAFIRQAMWGVVNEGGTAAASRLLVDGVAMAGKTGTAQVRRIVKPGESQPWKYRDHSLFIAFAPADKPHYAGACIIEHGGQGAHAAAPLMRDVMTYLFAPNKAMATLTELEQSWGGTIEERMKAQRARWDAAHPADGSAPAPQPANAVTSNTASNAASDTQPAAATRAEHAPNGKRPAADDSSTNDEPPAPPEKVNPTGPAIPPPPEPTDTQP